MSYDPNEVFAGNTSINAEIHEALAEWSAPSRSRMAAKIRQHRDSLLERKNRGEDTSQADQQARHIFREFRAARPFQACGIPLEYGRTIDGKTPDWSDDRIEFAMEVFTAEAGRSDPRQRLVTNITKKIDRYAELVTKYSAAFVVAVHPVFDGSLDPEHCVDVIQATKFPPSLSGVLAFGETRSVLQRNPDGSMRRRQLYAYRFWPNP